MEFIVLCPMQLAKIITSPQLMLMINTKNTPVNWC